MIEDPEYQALSQLLPFYVNGTLGAEECARIDAALATSTALREELAALGRLAQGVKTGGRELAQGDDQRAHRVGLCAVCADQIALMLLVLLLIATIAGAQAPAAPQATPDVGTVAVGANAGGGSGQFRLSGPVPPKAAVDFVASGRLTKRVSPCDKDAIDGAATQGSPRTAGRS